MLKSSTYLAVPIHLARWQFNLIEEISFYCHPPGDASVAPY